MRPTPELRAVLRGRDFRRLFAVRLTSQTADGIFQVGLASFVLFSPEKQTTASAAASAFAVLLLPYSLVGPFAGVFIDRWSRQRILVVANIIRAALVVVVGGFVAAEVTGVALYVTALAVLSVNRFLLAALSAALPHVVAGHRLVLANSLSTTSGTLAAITGGGIGLAISRLGASDSAVMVLSATVYLVSSLVAGRMARALLGPDHDPARPETVEALRRVALGMREGAAHIWARRRAGHALMAITAHRFFYGLSTISTFLLYRNYFENGRYLKNGLTGLGEVVFASAMGVLVAAVVTPVMTRRWSKERWIVALFTLAAGVEIVFGAPFTKAALLIAAFFLGLAAQGSKICVDTLVQESVEDDFRGRVFSFYDILFNVAFVAAAAAGAVVLPTSGKSYFVLAVIAVGYALTAGCYARVAQRWPTAAAGPAPATAPASEAGPRPTR